MENTYTGEIKPYAIVSRKGTGGEKSPFVVFLRTGTEEDFNKQIVNLTKMGLNILASRYDLTEEQYEIVDTFRGNINGESGQNVSDKVEGLIKIIEEAEGVKWE